MRILSIIGTRPQLIKHARLQSIMKKWQKEGKPSIKEVCVNTHQHYNASMNEDIIAELNLRIDITLSPTFYREEQLGLMLDELEGYRLSAHFDYLLVYGDTLSTLLGCIYARRHGIRLVHIEAGLRSFTPMIEEHIRIIADYLCDIAFCVDRASYRRLVHERALGMGGAPYLTGDILYDSYLANIALARSLHDFSAYRGCFILSMHRAELLASRARLLRILDELSDIAKNSGIKVVALMHHSLEMGLARHGIRIKKMPYITRFAPLTYLELLSLLSVSSLVLTDSGGLHREAGYADKPCLILRLACEFSDVVLATYPLRDAIEGLLGEARATQSVERKLIQPTEPTKSAQSIKSIERELIQPIAPAKSAQSVERKLIQPASPASPQKEPAIDGSMAGACILETLLASL